MSIQGAVACIIIGFAMFAAFSLVIIGALGDNPGFVTTGTSILTGAAGSVITYIFRDKLESLVKRLK